MRWSAIISVVLVTCAAKAEAACPSAPAGLLSISGEYQEGNLRGTFSRKVEPRTGRFVEAIDLGILTRGSGYEARLAWSRDVSGASHYLTSDFARRLGISEAWLSSHVACRSRAATHRHFTPPGGAPIELWYDQSGRLDRAILQYSENRLIHHYSDWRTVGPGMTLPFARRDEDPEDESEGVYTIQHVAPVKSASFAPPPLPHDSRIIGGGRTTVPFEDDGGRRVYLPVYLNRKGPFAFELDNGGHFILTPETASELGLAPQGTFASAGAGNALRQGGYVKLGAVRVGNAELVNQTAKVLPLSHNDRPGRQRRAGILGLEFFERFIVGVDHRNRTVTLSPMSDSAPTYPGRPLRLLFDEDAPLVTGAYEGVKGNFMLDIGNAGSTIIEDYWARRHGLTSRLMKGKPNDSEWLSTGTVSVGPFTLENASVSYYGAGERGSESTHSVAGVVGEPLLSRFNAVYDYGRQTVWLDPLPEKRSVVLKNRE
jgi:hypothetical protein